MTGVILSGGRNSRMGENKAFVEINGSRLIDKTVSLFQQIFDEIIIVTNSPLDYLDYDVTLVIDIQKDKGALGGLYTGLFFTSGEHAFVCGCDMPFLSGPFIHYMIGLVGDYDIIIPHSGDGVQPLHAIYGKRCLPGIFNLMERGNLKISTLLKGHKVLTINEDVINSFDGGRKMFFNVNSRADLKELLS